MEKETFLVEIIKLLEAKVKEINHQAKATEIEFHHWESIGKININFTAEYKKS